MKYRDKLEENNTEQEVADILDDIENDVNSIIRLFDCKAYEFDISDVHNELEKLSSKLF